MEIAWRVRNHWCGFDAARHCFVFVFKDECVRDIHHEGGSVLGSSRGGHDTKMICDAIEDFRFNQIYVIGGDGTHRGLIKLFEEFKKRKVKISVIGIPKTIDNDIALIDRSFGFETAVQEAQRAIISAKTEAISAFNGKWKLHPYSSL